MSTFIPRTGLHLDFVKMALLSGDDYPDELSKLPKYDSATPLLNFARSTAGGRFNAAGNFELLAAGQPRFDFDPVTLASRGLLIEGARTNLFLHSGDLTAAPWNQNGAVARLANAAVAPDGTNTATRITFSGAGEVYQYAVGYTGTFGSIWVKGTAGQTVNINALTIVLNGAWQRFSAANNVDGANNYISINNGGGGLSAAVIYAWGGQGENGAFSTTLIPATTASATRATEAPLKITSLTPWFNASAGTLVCKFDIPASLAGFPVPLAIGQDNNNDMYIYCPNAAPARVQVYRAGALQADLLLGNITPGTTHTVAFSYQAGAGSAGHDRIAAVMDGGTVQVVSTGLIPPITEFYVGSFFGATNVLNGHFARLSYSPWAMSDTQLKQQTSI